MEVQIKELKIKTSSGYPIAVSKFFSKTTINHTLVISSATGVLQKYYSRFANFYATKGITVYTFDYGGMGKSISSTTELKKHAVSLKDWGQQDQATVIVLAKEENPNSVLTLLTHSIGGQLLGFNAKHILIDQVIMVASQSGYWRHFKGLHRIKMGLFWYFLIPVFTPMFGYFPAKKLGLFENLPKKMVYEWASWGRKKEYMMHFKNEDYLFDSIKLPILSWSFPEDPFAPKEAVDWLANQYEKAQITRVHYPSKNEKQPRHFGFFKSDFKELLWEQNLNWMLTNTVA